MNILYNGRSCRSKRKMYVVRTNKYYLLTDVSNGGRESKIEMEPIIVFPIGCPSYEP